MVHVHGKEGHFIQNHFVTVMGYTYPLHEYAFLTFNNRGHDYLAEMLRKSTQGYEWITKGTAHDLIEECVHDINGVLTYVKDLGYKEIILQGHSIGPHKIAFYMANKPKNAVDKVILLSCGDVRYLLDAFVPTWRENKKVAKEMIKSGKGDELMPIRLWSNAPVSAKVFWHYTRSDSNMWIYNFSHPKLEFRHYNDIKIPILAISPETDVAIGVSPRKALDLMRERSSSVSFSSRIIKNTIHNYASKEDELSKVIVGWLSEHNK